MGMQASIGQQALGTQTVVVACRCELGSDPQYMSGRRSSPSRLWCCNNTDIRLQLGYVCKLASQMVAEQDASKNFTPCPVARVARVHPVDRVAGWAQHPRHGHMPEGNAWRTSILTSKQMMHTLRPCRAERTDARLSLLRIPLVGDEAHGSRQRPQGSEPRIVSHRFLRDQDGTLRTCNASNVS
eukprot:1923556-Prymnesium_polylepis.1